MRCLMTLVALTGLAGPCALAQVPSPEAAGEQALMELAFKGQLEQLRTLVSAGLGADVTDAEKRTPLMWAAFNGHTPVVSYLLSEGAKPDTKDVNGRTALMYASSGPFAETVELLLEKGVEVNLQGKLEGFTALMTAAAEGQMEVVRLLLDFGANPGITDKDGDTAESFARQKGHTEVAELLQKPPPATRAGK